ncbi:hypothetical protein [Rossellomorea marisflavi]|uniref:hypothetical protein n=1 Tax=Rossellomorea marisflavi TaxID=189381 RepID=UPI0011E881C4|nr:hypothetical protein [Rossellomorea marisflavi]TYO68698.1 hypothetical protein DQ398_003875 [Rossellomorea marisflavi]
MQQIIHFYPNSSGIQFIESFKKFISREFTSGYIHNFSSEKFLGNLQDRKDDNDIVLITAHGDEEHIVGENIKGRDIYLPFEALSNLKNSFVFAFACSTAKLGERICNEHEAISYLGFNDDIALVVKSDSYKVELTIILKKIYISALKTSFERFLKKGLQVKQLSLTISKLLLEEHSKIIKMSSEDIIQTFKLPRRVVENSLFRVKLQNELLNTISTVSNRIEIRGEDWFVPWYYLEDAPNNQLKKLLSELKKVKKIEGNSHKSYYYLMMAAISKKIGDDKEMNNYKQLLESIERESLFDIDLLLET